MPQSPLRTPADLGALIKDRRKALGLGQAELARRIGTARLWVAKLERGNPGANIGAILKALNALGLSLETIQPNQPTTAAPAIDLPDINTIIDDAIR